MSSSKHEARAFACNQCDKSFSHQSNLKLHQKTHTLRNQSKPQESNSFLCSICQQSFSQQGNLKLHHMTHTLKTKVKLEKTKNMNLNQEGAIEDNNGNKKLMDEPDGNIVFRCFFGCNKIFKTVSIFLEHTTLMHKENTKICPICCKAFTERKDLAKHVKTHDINKFQYRRYFPHKMIRRLVKGRSFEFDGRKLSPDYICDHCGKIFYEKTICKVRHIKAVHEKAHKCSVLYCAKSFESETSLKEHMKNNHATKFQCGECDESFSIFEVLNDHKRKHIDKPHKCKDCTNRFSSNDSLSIHSYAHSLLNVGKRNINLEDIIEEEGGNLFNKSEETVLEHDENEESIDNPDENKDFETHAEDNTQIDNKIVFRCSLGCSKEYKTPSDFWNHAIQMHKDNSRICPLCSKVFDGRKDLARHIIIHNESKFDYRKFLPSELIKTLNKGSSFEFDGRKVKADSVCEQCGKIFDEGKSHKFRHIKRVHEKAYKCSFPYCAKSFERESTLKEHLKKKVCGIDEKRNQCGQCNESFSLLEVLKDHKRKHIDKPHKCDTCENRFSSIDSLSNHIYMHTILSKIPCELCDETFDKGYLLQKHKNIFHGQGIQIDKLTCTDCGKICISNSMLKKHILKHTNVKNFICNLCGKALKEEKYLEFHMRRHSGNKQYHCDQCEASYFTATSLRNHQTAKHKGKPEESFLCTYCGISKNNKVNLKHHITLHTGEKKYKCSHCEKRFRHWRPRKDHEGIHTGVKDFTCEYCSKVFRLVGSLKRHTAIHTGERRHLCPDCSKTFIESGDVRKHMKVHHKDSLYIRIVKPKSSEK